MSTICFTSVLLVLRKIQFVVHNNGLTETAGFEKARITTLLKTLNLQQKR